MQSNSITRTVFHHYGRKKFMATMEQEVPFADPVFDNNIVPAIEGRTKFLRICRELYYHPTKMDVVPNDWKVYVFLQIHMGFVDISDKHTFSKLRIRRRKRGGAHMSHTEYSTNEHGQICELTLEPTISCDLPTAIRHLDHLELLSVGKRVKHIPLKELSLLPKLRTIACLDGLFRGSLCGLQKSVKLPHLKNLFLYGPSSTEMLYTCVALEQIVISVDKERDLDQMLKILYSYKWRFTKTLGKLVFIGGGNLKSIHLEKIIFQVLPLFPNLFYLHFRRCLDISCFKAVADRVRSDKSCIISKSLECIHIRDDRVHHQDCETDAAVLSFLQTFDTIEEVEFPLKIMCDIWGYTLVINRLKRRLLEGGGGIGSFPLALWPEIIAVVQRYIAKNFPAEESHKKTSMEASGIYYVLRQTPNIVGQCELASYYDVCPPILEAEKPLDLNPHLSVQTTAKYNEK